MKELLYREKDKMTVWDDRDGLSSTGRKSKGYLEIDVQQMK